MFDFRRNDCLDELYQRYLETFQNTLETSDSTGIKLYDFYLNYLLKCFKKDLKKSEFDCNKYFKFHNKRRRYDIKFENLNFSELTLEEISNLTFFWVL